MGVLVETETEKAVGEESIRDIVKLKQTSNLKGQLLRKPRHIGKIGITEPQSLMQLILLGDPPKCLLLIWLVIPWKVQSNSVPMKQDPCYIQC